MSVHDPKRPFPLFWTAREYAYDRDLKAIAVVEESRAAGQSRFAWKVTFQGRVVTGSSKTQKGARACCRRVARKARAESP